MRALAAAGAWSGLIVEFGSSPFRGGAAPLSMSRTSLQRRSNRLLVGGLGRHRDERGDGTSRHVGHISGPSTLRPGRVATQRTVPTSTRPSPPWNVSQSDGAARWAPYAACNPSSAERVERGHAPDMARCPFPSPSSLRRLNPPTRSRLLSASRSEDPNSSDNGAAPPRNGDDLCSRRLSLNSRYDPDHAPSQPTPSTHHILPAIREAPGFVAGYWLQPVDAAASRSSCSRPGASTAISSAHQQRAAPAFSRFWGSRRTWAQSSFSSTSSPGRDRITPQSGVFSPSRSAQGLH